jgi:hypothetical protein
VGDEGYPEEGAELTVAVIETALGAGQDADIDVGEHGEVVGQQTEGDGFSGARVASDECEAALADLLLHAPAEVIEPGGVPEGFDRDIGAEGVPLETVKAQELVGHSSSFLGM